MFSREANKENKVSGTLSPIDTQNIAAPTYSAFKFGDSARALSERTNKENAPRRSPRNHKKVVTLRRTASPSLALRNISPSRLVQNYKNRISVNLQGSSIPKRLNTQTKARSKTHLASSKLHKSITPIKRIKSALPIELNNGTDAVTVPDDVMDFVPLKERTNTCSAISRAIENKINIPSITVDNGESVAQNKVPTDQNCPLQISYAKYISSNYELKAEPISKFALAPQMKENVMQPKKEIVKQKIAACKNLCRAPIASLDCMEEFSGTGGHLDFGRSISLGSNAALPLRHGSALTPGLRYKNLGKSGLRVSNVGLGTWPVFSPGVSDEQAEAILKLAIESGINIFDISEAHSEEQIGKILQRTGWKRSSYVITTKVYWNTKSDERGLSRKHIIECVKATLQRLQLAYIDIVIIHKADAMCPMEEVVRAMDYVIREGWAMYWGTARWTHVEIMEAYTNCRQFNCITPIVEQSEYHMFCRDKCELYLPEMYNKIGVGLMAWGPLSMALNDTQNAEKVLFPRSTFKTKSYSWTEDEINRNATSPQGSWNKERLEEGRRHSDRLRDITALAEKLGCTPTQLSIAWSLKHEPVQCLLLSATSTEQLHQSLQSLQLLPRLSSSVVNELERILENKPVRPPMISTLALR